MPGGRASAHGAVAADPRRLRGAGVGRPRRIALIVEDLPERTPDEWVQGPPEHLREKAAAGFARKHGVTADDLEVRDGFLGVVVPGRPLEEALRNSWRTSSAASRSRSRWCGEGRPAFLAAGAPALHEARNANGRGRRRGHPVRGETLGHRFRGRVEIPSADEYVDVLRKAGVEPDPEERRTQIVSGSTGSAGGAIRQACSRRSCTSSRA